MRSTCSSSGGSDVFDKLLTLRLADGRSSCYGKGRTERAIRESMQKLMAAVKKHGREGRWQEALALVSRDATEASGLEPDAICMSAVVSACAKNRDSWPQSMSVLVQLLDSAVEPTTVTLNTGISVFTRAQRWASATHLAKAMESLVLEPDMFSKSAALTALDRTTRWQSAVSLQLAMATQLLATDVVCCTSLLTSCNKAGRWQLAAEMMEDFISDDSNALNAGLFNAAMMLSSQDVARSRPWAAACEMVALFRRSSRLSDARVLPAAFKYDAVLDVCRQCKAWQQSLALWALLKTAGSRPDSTRWCKAARARTAGRTSAEIWTEALAMMQQMSNSYVRAATWLGGERGCVSADWHIALALLVQMQREVLQVAVLDNNDLANLMSAAGTWRMALHGLQGQRLSDDIRKLRVSSERRFAGRCGKHEYRSYRIQVSVAVVESCRSAARRTGSKRSLGSDPSRCLRAWRPLGLGRISAGRSLYRDQACSQRRL
eukprot:TRINITY_DN43484_c0_g1_i3.p1 TRINITY_DN43484_c0_g1~~TRINITY_DN43484_c0_g1_i3.p1  ORF type:complete len:490 (+),score=75.34 TRINITY_DN43484_c0_g1_i3:356-1825(+)